MPGLSLGFFKLKFRLLDRLRGSRKNPGQTVPDMGFVHADGKPVKLSELLEGKKGGFGFPLLEDPADEVANTFPILRAPALCATCSYSTMSETWSSPRTSPP